MDELGYNKRYTSTVGRNPAALGNRIAINILHFGLNDRSNEQDEYAINNGYLPVNPPLVVKLPGVGEDPIDPNRWQPLALDFFVDQGGNPLPINVQEFLGPHWGQLPPFALTPQDMNPLYVYHDPGLPPQLGGAEDFEYRDMFTDNVRLQSYMDPTIGIMIDVGPGAFGNNTLGTNDGTGHPINPVTGMPYEPNVVPLGDWSRCIAEFWADGPDSETPPGHWNTLSNYVSEQASLEKRLGGIGPVVDDLEWDVKLYLALNGAVYDAAVAAWGIKGFYDYVRPITSVRYMSERGQSSNPLMPSFHPEGILLENGIVEVITTASVVTGERHDHLADHVDEIAVLAWPGTPASPETEFSGVEWILGTEWVPYQRPTFVTPPFAGYISGHSTFSRAAAEVLTAITGEPYFPGGLGTFFCPMNEFLVFEDGPSVDVTLTWGTYYDAADESGQSRLWGGIHPRADDFPGRIIGSIIGMASWDRAQQYYAGDVQPLLAAQGLSLR
jgi:hypothetical protein